MKKFNSSYRSSNVVRSRAKEQSCRPLGRLPTRDSTANHNKSDNETALNYFRRKLTAAG